MQNISDKLRATDNRMEIKKERGERLKKELKKARLSQVEFAELAGYSNPKSISLICTGRRSVPDYKFEEFEEIINDHLKNDYVSADYLRGIVDYRNDIDLLTKETEQLFASAQNGSDLERTLFHLLELKGYRMVSRQLINWNGLLHAIGSCSDRSALAPVHFHIEKYDTMQAWKEGEQLTEKQFDACIRNLADFFPEYIFYEFKTPEGDTRIIRHIELVNTFKSIEATAAALLEVGMEQTKSHVVPAP